MKYRCDVCGHDSPKWMGFCPQCKADGALVEIPDARREAPSPDPPRSSPWARPVPARWCADPSASVRSTGSSAEASCPAPPSLLGGEPGVGKSTLLLQVAAALSARARPRLSPVPRNPSIRSGCGRAARRDRRWRAVDRRARRRCHRECHRRDEARPADRRLDPDRGGTRGWGSAGGVAQVRESAARLIHAAKESKVPVVLIGHVTKDGASPDRNCWSTPSTSCCISKATWTPACGCCAV